MLADTRVLHTQRPNCQHKPKLRTRTFNAPKVRLDLLLERARGELPAPARLRREVLPEERVVDVAPAVELERGLEADALARRGGLGVRVLGSVQAVHVRLVVLRVVQLHDLARDVRLEGLCREEGVVSVGGEEDDVRGGMAHTS